MKTNTLAIIVLVCFFLSACQSTPITPSPTPPATAIQMPAPSATPLPSPSPSPATPDPAGEWLAVVGGMLIDGTGAAPAPDAVVLIQGDRIAAVGPRDRVQVPAGARVIDARGKTVLPGFINAHVHSSYVDATLQAWARGGVTTVRDLGMGAYSIESVRDKFVFRDKARARPELARIVSATPLIAVPGGYGSYTIRSPQEATQAVNDLLDAGADVVKSSFEDNLIGRTWNTLTDDEARALVAAAHKRGKWAAFHVSRSPQVERALAAGADELSHMAVDAAPDDLLARVAQAGVYWAPTLELWQGVGWGEKPTDNLRRFVAAGGRVALGTDYAGYTTPFDLGMPMTEIRWMRKAGMTPMQIIVAATQNAAHVCGLEGELGTLEQGKRADLIVVPGNPLADLEILGQVQYVIHDGVVIKE